MFIRCYFLVVLTAPVPLMAASSDWKTNTASALKNHCYVRAWSILKDQQDEDPLREALLNRLDNESAWPTKRNDLSLTDDAYRRGYGEWRNNQVLEAKNWWRKYLTYCRMGAGSCRKLQREEIEEFSSTVVFSPPAVVRVEKKEETPAEVVSAPAPPKKKTPVVGKLPPEPKIISKPSETSEKLAREARRARENGQLEYALRLYRLAENADPSGVRFESEIGELTKIVEVGGL